MKKVVVDTSVWSLLLRRKGFVFSKEVECLQELIRSKNEILLPGIVLQELLVGIKNTKLLQKIIQYLTPFPLLEPHRSDYIFAAELTNHCRSKGIQASLLDFLVASICIQHGCALLTTDGDFQHIARFSDLTLLEIPKNIAH